MLNDVAFLTCRHQLQDLSDAILNSNVCQICPKSNSGSIRQTFGPSSRYRTGISFEIGGRDDDDEEQPSTASKAKDSLKFESEILLASGPRDIEVAGSPIPRGHLVQVYIEKKCRPLPLSIIENMKQSFFYTGSLSDKLLRQL